MGCLLESVLLMCVSCSVFIDVCNLFHHAKKVESRKALLMVSATSELKVTLRQHIFINREGTSANKNSV